ncbi:MAG: hypothetical protein Q7N50_14605 [Armatimonadota bacterium]|nr:hypothetical protein [Armatimonadota bacterium]
MPQSRPVFLTTLFVSLLTIFAVPPIFALAPAPVDITKPGMSILRRTPVLDGVVEAGEWDSFFTVQQEGFSATAYSNWDEGNLYIAIQGSKPTDMVLTLDANNDGWFHGSDNYQVKATNGTDNIAVKMEKYDSKAKMQTPGATESVDSSGIVYKTAVKPDSFIIEMAIPADALNGFKPTPSSNIGMRINLKQAVEGAAWAPMTALGDVEACCLSDNKASSMDQMEIKLVLADTKVNPGQTLSAKLYIKNNSAQSMPFESFVIGGDGRAAKFLNSEKIRMEGLEPGKTIKHKFESKIPSDMPVGFWAIGAEVRNSGSASERAGAALASFEVVKPFVIELDCGEGPMVLGGQSERTVCVKILNQTPGRALGEVTITLPDGWRLKPNLLTRRFEIRGEDQTGAVSFKIRPPADAMRGEITLKVDVKINGETYSLGQNLTLMSAMP